MSDAIRTEGLTKRYGDVVGVTELDLQVARGEVFGFLGPNGAGKTTTIRLLLDLIRPTGGRAEVLGLDVHEDAMAVHERVGYLPGELRLPERITAGELLTHLGDLRGGVDPDRVAALAARLRLDLHRDVGDLSSGNKQKVGLVQALAHEPEVLILDEPTSGLDPLMQDVFLDLVREATARGATVFLSSHVLSEVERIAHRVGILRQGSLVEVADVQDLKARALRELVVRFGEPVDADDFGALPGVRVLGVEDRHVRFQVEGSLDALVKALATHEVVNIVTHEADLEAIFRTYYAGGDA